KRWCRLCWREEWESFRLIVGAECGNVKKEVKNKYVFHTGTGRAFKDNGNVASALSALIIRWR
ncbi:11028_t:CDS:1, partial [Paraglomus occultum]